MSARILFASILMFLSCLAHAGSVLVWGDSLSAGYGLRNGEAWPTLLQTRLAEKGFALTVVNGSVSGETTAGGASRLAEALARVKPAVVVLELGANDGLRGLSLAQMEDNLRRMINEARAADARVLLVGMRMPPNLGPVYTERFHAVYTRLAAEMKLPLVPFLLAGLDQRTQFQPDNLHPVAAAQGVLLDNVWPELKPLLRRR